MRRKKFLLLAILAVVLSACGGGDKDVAALKVESELGELGNYISINDSEIKITKSEVTEEGTEYVVLQSNLSVSVNQSVASDYSSGFNLKAIILDKDQNEIAPIGSFDFEVKSEYYNDDYIYILNSGSTRAQLKEGGKKEDWNDETQALWDKICKEGTYVLLKPDYSSAKYIKIENAGGSSVSFGNDDNGEASEEDESTEEIAESNSENWDDFLNSYESYVDKYIAALKKASNGDMSALTEYASLLEEAQDYGDKLSKATGSLTAAQLKRYTQIHDKLIKAASELN